MGVYSDLTKVGFVGDAVPGKYQAVFEIVAAARDAGIECVRSSFRHGRGLQGWEVDRATRDVIEQAGYGEYFTHRTGHSIGSEVHGTGPSIDNLETEDGRKLQQGHLFSIEPGMYFKDCGMRTEVNMLIGHNGGEVSTLPLQTEILPLL